MKSVAHITGTYTGLTETFIRHQVDNLERYDPFVSCIYSENEHLYTTSVYPFMSQSKFSSYFWYNGIRAKLNIQSIQESHTGGVLNKRSSDIIHAHFGTVAKDIHRHRRDDQPLITSFYGYDASKKVHQDPSIKSKYLNLFKKGDLFLAEGPAMKQKLRQLGCPESKLAVQRIAIEGESIKPQYYQQTDHFTILMVGRFVRKKGLPDGIRAFAAAFSTSPNVELRIIGDEAGEYSRESLEKVAADTGVEDQTTFLGYLSHDQYLSEIESCDLLFAPSKLGKDGDSEGGAPTVLLEAQATGKPVVSTTHADIPFIVEDGRTGLLAPPENITQLSKHLRTLYNDTQLMQEMGKNAREQVLAKHDVSTVIPKLEDYYDAVIESSNL